MNNLIRSLYFVLIAFVFISCESEGLDLLLSENRQSEKYEYAIQVAKARYCESSIITRGKNSEARISRVYAISLNHPHEFQRTIDTLYTCFLETHWHQNSPLNAFCYHNGVNIPTGCVPVAVGQIVAKNQYPDSFHGFSFNWDYISHDSLPVLSSETAKVAHLLNDLRIITHHDGDTTGHGGDPRKIVNAFDSLGYSHSNLVEYDYNTAMGDFENGRPVLIRGAKENNQNVGHAWVADGIQVSSVHAYNFGSNTFTRLDIRREIHFNWGFGGNFDGYFLSDVFDPDEEGTAYTSYSHDTGMIHNIIPANH